MFLGSQKAINLPQAVELEIADCFRIAPKESVGFLARKVGGLENLGFISEDYNNYLRSRRTEAMKVGDTGGVLEYLQNMQHDDPNFSYAIQVDLDDLITNIFWTYGRMKLDYESFGDVVCFDTTYRKNKEGRPLHYLLVLIIISKVLYLVQHCYMIKHVILLCGYLIHF